MELSLPKCPLNIKREPNGLYVLDGCRKKWVKFTPEEYVRQTMMEYIISSGINRALVANEQVVEINGMKKRCDAVIYNSRLQPIAIFEFKAPTVALSQKVMDQIFAYNRELPVPILVASNGLQHICISRNEDGISLFPFAELQERLKICAG
ncbi:MAG: type I restriction enzyme HsdR N-terminal domain-containing protein [Paludibacteraceae bacterium]|nr:type I restriction enzyme HsdR N-terminal domain-containing protein [Paludibacteraceae bacterium]